MSSPAPALPVALLATLVATSVAACDPREGDAIYATPDDVDLVCGLNMRHPRLDANDLDRALDRAVEEGTIVQFYDHQPQPQGPSHPSRIESLLANAAERGMSFVTYREMAEHHAAGGSVALSFDDTHIDEWYALRPFFERYHARTTFFVTRFHTVDDEQLAKLEQLEADGHDIEYHGSNHQHSVQYVKEHGIDSFMHDEIEPDLGLMRQAGFDPVVFAYPFSERNADTDAALLQTFKLLRGGAHHCK